MSITSLGAGAAASAVNSDHSTVIGEYAGNQLLDSQYAAVLGPNAGEQLKDSLYATVIGPSAGRFSEGGEGAIYLGICAGYFAKISVKYSTIIGYAAARYVEDNTYSQIIGYAAGEYSHRSHLSVLLGHHSGYQAWDSPRLVALGNWAGAWVHDSPDSVLIGHEAGGVEKLDADTTTPFAHHVVRGVYIGRGAGKDSANTTDVVLIGTDSKADAGVENAIALGKDAHATQSNSMNVPVLKRVGGGVLVVDENGNVTSSDQLAQALATIAALTARIEALEAS